MDELGGGPIVTGPGNSYIARVPGTRLAGQQNRWPDDDVRGIHVEILFYFRVLAFS